MCTRSVAALSALVCGVAALTVSLHADKKKAVVTWARKPPQSARLAQLPLVVARQKCENWAWAAALETVLRLQDAPIAQEYWVQRQSRGEVCLPRAESFDKLARFLESDYYVLDNGRKLRLQVQYREGAPTSADDLIASVQHNPPMMLFWRGHAYVVAGVVYDEYIAPTGSRMFEVRELKLLDPFVDPRAGPAPTPPRSVLDPRPEAPPPVADDCRTSGEKAAPAADAGTPKPAPDAALAAAGEKSAAPSAGQAQPCLPEDPRIVSFVKGRDNLAEIDGTFQVRVVWQ